MDAMNSSFSGGHPNILGFRRKRLDPVSPENFLKEREKF